MISVLSIDWVQRRPSQDSTATNTLQCARSESTEDVNGHTDDGKTSETAVARSSGKGEDYGDDFETVNTLYLEARDQKKLQWETAKKLADIVCIDDPDHSDSEEPAPKIWFAKLFGSKYKSQDSARTKVIRWIKRVNKWRKDGNEDFPKQYRKHKNIRWKLRLQKDVICLICDKILPNRNEWKLHYYLCHEKRKR